MAPERYADFFKCFSHPSRLMILEHLAKAEESTVDALSAQMAIDTSTVSRHLSLLRLQGVVSMRQEGQHRIYALEPASICDTFAALLSDLKVTPAGLGG